ncbi:MAG TPA: hypothetical protein VGL77_20080 [Armatimonadota bacterium]
MTFRWSVSLANPMVQAHGNGPDGMRCQHCAFLRDPMKTPLSCTCALRGISAGTRDEHRESWPACKRFMRLTD